MVWLILFIIQLLRLSSAHQGCIDTDKDHAAIYKQYDLFCGPSEIIVEVNVTSGTGSCKYPGCYGESSQLLVETHNCYWKNNCTIGFPKDIIIKSVTGSCWGLPELLYIYGYSCLKQGLPRDLMAGDQKPNERIDICGEYKDVHSVGGLLYSHDYYPWMYKFQGITCSKTFWFKSDKLGKMVVTVLDLEIDEDDSLRVNTGTLTSGDSKVFEKNIYKNDDSVTFEFTVNPVSNKGRGFVVCFKFVDSTTYNEDACQLLGMTFKSNYSPRAVRPNLDMSSLFEDVTTSTTTTTTTTARTTTTETTTKKVCFRKNGRPKKCRSKKRSRRDPIRGRKKKKKKNKKRKSAKRQQRRPYRENKIAEVD